MMPDTSPHNALARLAEHARSSLPMDAARIAAGLAWTQASLRKRAVEKLGDEIGQAILFDNDGLQMSSGIITARYHAGIALRSGARTVVDMTAGVGVDALVFAQAGLDVIAFEMDAARAALLAANVERLGLHGKIEVRQGDSLADGMLSGFDSQSACFYLDPPRRDDSSRWGRGDLAESMLNNAVQSAPSSVLMKLSPAVDLELGKKLGAEMELISVEGECREALLRWGGARLSDLAMSPSPSAVILPVEARMSAGAVFPERGLSVPTRLDEARYLYEPDAAVIRAGLVGRLAAEQGWTQFDTEVAYLVSNSRGETPFARGYRILAAAPYHKRTVQAWLDEHNATQLIVKKRGVPDEPEAVRRLFKLHAGGNPRDANPAILALTRQGKQRWALFLERL